MVLAAAAAAFAAARFVMNVLLCHPVMGEARRQAADKSVLVETFALQLAPACSFGAWCRCGGASAGPVVRSG